MEKLKWRKKIKVFLLIRNRNIVMQTSLQNLLTVCLPNPPTASQDSIFYLCSSLFYPNSLSKSTSIRSLSSLLMVSLETVFLRLYFFLPMTYTTSRGQYQETSCQKMTKLFLDLFFFSRSRAQRWIIMFLFFQALLKKSQIQ